MMIEFIVLIIGMVIFAIAALRWSYDSRDGINSPEWERRQRWYGFH